MTVRLCMSLCGKYLHLKKCLIYKNLQNVAKGGMAPRPMVPTMVRQNSWEGYGMHRHSSCYTPSSAYIGFLQVFTDNSIQYTKHYHIAILGQVTLNKNTYEFT